MIFLSLSDLETKCQDIAFLEALSTVGYQCARADSAPGDVICTDAGEDLHQRESSNFDCFFLFSIEVTTCCSHGSC